ncbi:MAG: ATP-binding cassette domain-containing protein [Spirochaetaceae bacterium]|jgi:ABC-type nitrate/sulfonate/bicarbonate transport system ATPase subunit|nr:ATP-binding cassette domain-containing protein [Spirochaetaceae bacterium]
MTEPVFFCRNITKTYQGEAVIRGIDLDLPRGGIISLVGPSGVGKTTLFNILAGVDRADEGRIVLDGRDITGISGRVSYMMQKDLLLEYRTVLDNVILPLVIKKTFGGGFFRGGLKKAREYAASFFETFGLEGCEHKYPRQLSGGMRQRAALLRTCMQNCRDPESSAGTAQKAAGDGNGGALSGPPSVILLDEPFSALDALTRGTMQAWFLDIGRTMELSSLFITHDVEEAVILSDRVYIMTAEKIRPEGPAKGPGRISAVFDRPGRRKNRDFSLTPEFTELKKRILRAVERAGE